MHASSTYLASANASSIRPDLSTAVRTCGVMINLNTVNNIIHSNSYTVPLCFMQHTMLVYVYKVLYTLHCNTSVGTTYNTLALFTCTYAHTIIYFTSESLFTYLIWLNRRSKNISNLAPTFLVIVNTNKRCVINIKLNPVIWGFQSDLYCRQGKNTKDALQAVPSRSIQYLHTYIRTWFLP